MDLILLFGVAIALLVILVTLFFLQKRQSPLQENGNVQRPVPVRAPQDGMRRRAEIARNQRNRLRNAAAPAPDSSDSNEDDNEGENTPVLDEKMGAKKRAKLEAKAEKRAHREAELQSREDKKQKEALADEEKKRIEEKAEIEERRKTEAERLEREKKEREEYEEYLKMKAAFSIEEEGFEEGDDNEKDNLLQEFIQYIKDNKVVVLEDLATHFKLKTQQAIDRITELQKNNTLTGVIDDRGKFIYISEDELKSVAKFIKQRGRISITELAESSNNLINLTPVSS